jgi:sec-independent protein translocase protein TatC
LDNREHRNEEASMPFLIAAPGLFSVGGAFAYYLVFPVAWAFLISLQTPTGGGGVPIAFLPKVGEYLDTVMKLIFAFGIAFEMPVALALLGRASIVTSRTLRRGRWHAVVLTFTLAGILTPLDAVSRCCLALAMMALYEASILLLRRAE